MNKKLLFHIIICALLFVAVTIPYSIFADKDSIPYAEAQHSPENPSDMIQDGEIIIIGEAIELYYVPDSVSPGEDTFIKIVGKPDTLYDINVYYPSGISTAKAFADKYSDENGIVSWEFKVSAKTTAKNLRVVIRSESSYISFYIHIKKL